MRFQCFLQQQVQIQKPTPLPTNPMQFHRSKSLFWRIMPYLLKLLPIEPEHRTRLAEVITSLFYLLDYLTILALIIFDRQPIAQLPNASTIILVLNLVRMQLGLLYIGTKVRAFLLGQNTMLLLACLFTQSEGSWFVVFDVLSAAVWALTLEQKNVHFDSRLFIRNAMLKKVLICFFFLYKFALTDSVYFSWYGPALFCVLFLAIDLQQILYYRKFRHFLILMDIGCLANVLVPPLYNSLGYELEVPFQLLLNLINLCSILLYVYLLPQNYDILYNIDPWHEKIEPYAIVQYFCTLKQLIRAKTQQSMIKYLIFHCKSCTEPKCSLAYHYEVHRNSMDKLPTVLDQFIKQEVPNLAERCTILQYYFVINFYSKCDEVTRFVDLNDFFHLREDKRFIDHAHLTKDMNKKQQVRKENQFSKPVTDVGKFEYELEVDIEQEIKTFVQYSIEFWTELLGYSINAEKLIKTGIEKIRAYQKIENVLKNRLVLTERSRMLAKTISAYLLKTSDKFQQARNQIENNLSGYIEASPTIMVSAEKSNFLQIIDINTAALKATSFAKSEIIGVTVDNMWDIEIRAEHIKMAKKRAKYSKFEQGSLVESIAFFKNKFGYTVFCDAIVYYFDDLKGKKWCVVTKPYLSAQAMIVLNSRRELIGINELCVAQGLSKNQQGNIVNQNIINQCITSKRRICIRNKAMFENSNFILGSGVNMTPYITYQTTIYFNGRPTYFVFTITLKQGTENVSRASINNVSMDKSLPLQPADSSDMLQKQGILAQENSLTPTIDPPSFQFKYDQRGKLFKNRRNRGTRIITENSTVYNMTQDYIDEDSQQQINQSAQRQNQNPKPNQRYDEDIIQMRYWNSTLDFIQNLQVPPTTFPSLPQHKIQNYDVNPYKVRENYEMRAASTPKNLLFTRVYFVLCFLVVLGLVLYINLSSVMKKHSSQTKTMTQGKLFNQLNQLISLGTIFISRGFNASVDVGSQIAQSNQKIQQSYTDLANNIQNFNRIAELQIEGRSLKEYDDLYRLLVKNRANNQSIGNYEVLNHLSRYVYAGWTTAINAEIDQARQNSHKRTLSYYIFTSVAFFVSLLFVFLFFKLKSMIEKTQLQICIIFTSLNHLSILQQVLKLKSFSNLLNCNQSLLDQQALNQLKQQSKTDKIHQKRIVNKNKHITECVLILICFLCFLSYYGLAVYKQYTTQDIYLNHLELMHNAYSSSIKMSMLWVGLNIYPRQTDLIDKATYNFIEEERNLELRILDGFRHNKFNQTFNKFLIAYRSRNICINLGLHNGCRFDIEGTQKRGNKQVNIYYLRYRNRIIEKYIYQSQFLASPQAKQMYRIQSLYYSAIGDVIAEKVNEDEMWMIKKSEQMGQNIVVVLIVGVLLGAGVYVLMAVKIREVARLEKILTWINFEALKENKKYWQFFYDNKVKLR